VLERVISGGQTGADRAALMAARAAGLATGARMPRGFLAHDGPRPEFAALYGMMETVSRHYPSRTGRNVREADATLCFATNWESPGELLTHRFCLQYDKPYLDVTPHGDSSPTEVASWIIQGGFRVLNVAGNAESTSPGIEEYVSEFLENVFRIVLLSRENEMGAK
jgi:hypothetical protein